MITLAKIINRFTGGAKISEKGSNNEISINSRLRGVGTLKVIIKGNNNKVIIGEKCRLRKTNTIFITGDNNTVEIGEHVFFDQNVSLVCCEGTTIKIYCCPIKVHAKIDSIKIGG